jgi:alkyl sulfatase BDS1-like metallo-beta-lactamase superfamily hydrolase
MTRRTPLLLLALALAACGGDESVTPGGVSSAGPIGGDQATRNLAEFGKDQTEPYEIAEGIYQAHGTGNAHLIVTPAGDVVFDAGLTTEGERHRELLNQASTSPVRYAIASHAHADHSGGIRHFAGEDTEIVAHRTFPETQRYLVDLLPYFMPRNRIFYPEQIPALPIELAGSWVSRLYPKLEPTILVDDTYAFELGGQRFELLHTPGAEGEDSISLWLPDRKILFTGDFFGPLFPMWPNLYTIRGEKNRFAIPYIQSLERLIALEPEVLVPSHFMPIEGKEQIRADMTRIRDAVQYVHDATVAGMNEGKELHALMREIRLPEELELSEGHGKVAWGVRSIWEGYSGWFRTDTVDLYDVPARAVHGELAQMAGGGSALAERALARLAANQPVEALHLLDVAQTAEPGNPAVLRARIAVLERLLELSGDVNHSEVFWLRGRIAATREQLDEG